VCRLCTEQEDETLFIVRGENGRIKFECCGTIVVINTGRGAESTIKGEKGRAGMFDKLLELELCRPRTGSACGI